ncbi:hypothetical protein EVAR_85660_1 [Eumeta japonica]|uniref:Uncharacterized protein n=1 Tax=Eumeta variegata TaxID=151549 RepID=A0A4C1XTZ7_EUMVA|nr:hypothetical protein EVAR_85660_1 [Eumeta japonica]
MERWLKGVKHVATSSNKVECSKACAENIAITDPDDDATTSSSTVSKTKKRKVPSSILLSKRVPSPKDLRTAAQLVSYILKPRGRGEQRSSLLQI